MTTPAPAASRDDTGADMESAIRAIGIVPVVVLDDAADAAPLAAALIAGGLPVAEVTFRTAAAAGAIAEMATDPRMLVGAGTVLTTGQVDQAMAAGARFIVSPGFSDAVVRHCLDRGIPVFPGVATAGEVQRAFEAGLRTVKFFPAEAAGGLAALKAIGAPYTMMRFIPTGGIGPDTASAYLRHPAVVAVGGSWMVARSLVAERRFDEVTRLAAAAVSIAAAAR
jgi:2-dehydro-3-deoxyphosphogluconate aldolase/(4S)-4-hydroxy-2-oxoglutarate aldolase